MRRSPGSTAAPARPRQRRLGLLGKFALASALPIVLLGMVLARTLADSVRDRALDEAEDAAVLVGTSFVRPYVDEAALEHGLSDEQVAELDRMLAGVVESGRVVRVKVWSRDGLAVYADDRSIIGETFEVGDDLAEALEGEVSSEVSDLEDEEEANERGHGRLLEVYVPLHEGVDGEALGAFEIYMSYEPIARDVAHDTRLLYAALAGGLAILYLALFRIVAGASRRFRAQATENEYLALHDTLTGLPNRNLFRDRADQALRLAERDGAQMALLLVDLDRFKEVNDTLGHHNGDVLLTQVGERLRQTVRDSDTVARLGGDEFGLVLTRIADGSDAVTVAEKVREEIRRPITLEGVVLEVESSIGIACFPEHGTDVDTLLQRADVAMYVAKEEHGGCELYRADHDEYSTARLALVAELRRAIDEGELLLYYQPKAMLRSGEVVGVEALVRWQHPERGLLEPVEFVPTAEHTGLIKRLTRFVLEAALRQLREWRDAGIDLSVSVNLSARDLLDLDLPDRVEALLREHDVPADHLLLEITESVLLADPVRARVVVDRLSALGVHLAIDDFGTGYSSLAYLERLPVDEIKIDKTFVLKMEEDENDAVIVRSIVDLGHNLGLVVVAEGVEDLPAWTSLRDLGCDLAQGYLLSRPLPADRIPDFVAGSSAREPAND